MRRPISLYQLKVTLEDTRPAIWRRLLVPGDTKLSELHHVLQIAFGWADTHLHQFEAGEQLYGLPDGDDLHQVRDERKVTLWEIAEETLSFVYEYDFGDSWRHQILVENELSAGERVQPVCIEGRRAGPPEDCGGAGGYGELLEILRDPTHDRYEQMREWAGDFDPEAFDVIAVNAALAQRYAKTRRRRAPRQPS